MRDDLKWWCDFAPSFNGHSLIPYVTHHTAIYTDSSLRGFGAYYGHDWLLGFWQPVPEVAHLLDNPHGHFSPPPEMDSDHAQNINVLELWAVVAALEKWAPHLSNTKVVMYIYNQQVIGML